MPDSKSVARGAVALVLTATVGGCVGPGGLPLGGPELAGWATRARSANVPPAGPDLRIPEATVAASEIPLVPVPPPPLGSERVPGLAPPTAPPILPASPLAAARGPAPTPPVIATTSPQASTPVAGTPAPPAPPSPLVGPAGRRAPGGTPGPLDPLPTPTSPAVSTPTPAPPAAVPATSLPLSLRQLHQQAVDSYAGIDSYIARLTRREQVNGKDQPEEVLLFKFRKEPWSVHFKWLGSSGQGREVVYVKDRHENKIHTLLAAGDHPLLGAGKRISLAVDSIFVRSASRHPITEAGIGASIDRLGSLIEAQERGDKRRGTLTALGPQKRPEFDQPIQMLEQAVPPGADPNLPHGGKRLYGFDPQSHLPVLVSTHDDRGQEVEYYCYDRLLYPVHLGDDDFDPDKLWSKPKPPSPRPAGTPPSGPALGNGIGR